MIANRISGDGPQAPVTSPRKGEVGAKRRVGVDAAFAHSRGTTAKARSLRRAATPAERKLWSVLRGAQIEGASFRRQHPVKGYYLDFWCAAARLAIELDGAQHGFERNMRRDARRTEVLAAEGIEILRFWNNDVLTNLGGVVELIQARLRERMPSTPTRPAADLPLSGGGNPWAPAPLVLLPQARAARMRQRIMAGMNAGKAKS